MKTLPGLQRYAHMVRDAAEEKAHSLPAGEAAIVSQVASLAQGGNWAMYQQLERTAPFGKIQTNQGERDVYTDASVLALDSDPAVRREAWQRYWGGFAQRQDLFATTLLSIVRQHDLNARLHHYPDAPARLYAAAHLSSDEVNQTFAQVRAGSGLLKRYQRLRAQRIGQEYGIAEVHAWDSQLPARGLTPPRLTLDQTRAMAQTVLQPLGADYVAHFRDLVDPANGRLDVAATKGNRASNSTSVDAPGVPTGLFVEIYDTGMVAQSDVVIHEGGHALHNQYMNEAGVSEFARGGPRWMFEAFAHLNGYLLLDHLAKTAPDAATRAHYLEAYLNKLSLEVFGSAQEGLLEQQIYEGVAAGRIKNAADLNALTLQVWSEFEVWPEKDTALQHIWMQRRLFFNDPLYYFNYLFAGGLSLKLVDMAQADPVGFAPRYNRLLRAGFSETPQTLLKEFFGKDISQGELMKDAMRSFETKLTQLEKTYQAMDAAKRP
jgi:oligoendopeptidase F